MSAKAARDFILRPGREVMEVMEVMEDEDGIVLLPGSYEVGFEPLAAL